MISNVTDWNTLPKTYPSKNPNFTLFIFLSFHTQGKNGKSKGKEQDKSSSRIEKKHTRKIESFFMVLFI